MVTADFSKTAIWRRQGELLLFEYGTVWVEKYPNSDYFNVVFTVRPNDSGDGEVLGVQIIE